jgi:EpsI family protein
VRVISSNLRFAAVSLLLAGTALFLHARAHSEFPPLRTSLTSFPIEFGSWAGTDVAIPADILKRLGRGEYLQRIYSDRKTPESYAGLFVSYVPNQLAIFRHLPQNCLEGSGWLPLESGTISLALPGEAPFQANRYLIARGSDRQLVLFWYAAHGRRMASPDWADFYLVVDALRLNRSDNALIRINTELRPGESPGGAEQRLVSFAGLVNPLLDSYIPR